MIILEYLIVALLVVALVLLIAILIKNNGEGNITERVGRMETSINKEIGDFKLSFSRDLRSDFDKLNDHIEKKLMDINDRVNARLDQNFEKTNKAFTGILERLSKIDEAQKKIDGLSSEIVSLQSVLTDKKTRGIFGEVNLNYILTNIFGEKREIYDVQHKLSNGSIADAIIFAPEPLGKICIDSKFPLENYRKMVDKTLTPPEREAALKLFHIDVKKHIEAISSKYIIIGETSNEAILFLPAEAIFAEINAYHPELLTYAYERKVWITGPTTLMSTLSIVQMIVKNMERDKYAEVIHTELSKLSYEFSRYKERWDKLSRSIDSVSKDVKEINITTEKITKRFDSINSVDSRLLEYKEEPEIDTEEENQ